ncbi:MAG: hypothetical protein AAFR88_13335, partial [Pseudomonadota bacterium]
KRQRAKAEGRQVAYDGTWRDADPEEVQRRLDAGEPHTVRFRAPKVGDSVEFKPATMGTYWIRVNGRKGVRGNRIG